MARNWYTSDLHIGHFRVAETRCASKGVVFDSAYRTPEENRAHVIAWHDAHLAKNWDDHIQADDNVWILGDISVGGSQAQRDALEWVSKRRGHKHLIAGNHDGVHPQNRDAHKWFKPYAEVFDSVNTAARRRIVVRGERVELLLSHYPYTGDHTEHDRDVQWRLREASTATTFGTTLLHGHTHSEKIYSRSSHGASLQIHVGLDAHNLQMISQEYLITLLEDEQDWSNAHD